MEEDFLLMNPGPVPLEPEIRREMSSSMYSHRSSDFEEVHNDCTSYLKSVFQTRDDIVVINGSGTAAMEAGISNTIQRDDHIACLVNGKFGRRLKRISDRYAGAVTAVEVEWGSCFDMDEVTDAIKSADAVTMVHNETSTGILNPAAEVGELASKHDALYIMDGVTSIGGDDVPVDEWMVDLAIVGSQKCLGAPPGLSALSISDDAKSRIKGEEAPFYLDLDKHLTKLKDHQTPYTSSVSLFRGLQKALEIIDEEGLDDRVKRHRDFSRAIREAVKEMGLSLFPELESPSTYSNTVTAVEIPDGVTDKELRGGMMDRGISISGGQAYLSGDIFRIATMANIKRDDVIRVITELQEVLDECGFNVEGDGAGAASDVLEG